MFLLSKPDDRSIKRFLKDRESDTFSYSELGATLESAPSGYNIDHNRIKLGVGLEVFDKAKTAIHNWKMFDIPWVRLINNKTPIEIGKTVAILVSHFGFYSLNAARIVYVLDEQQGDIHRYGFAYGTLTEHGEIGEERFSVEFHPSSGEVWYDLYAFSRPASLLAKIGYPLSRNLQKTFARDSETAMLRAVFDASTLAKKS